MTINTVVSTADNPRLLGDALRYADLGLPVFPVAPRSKVPLLERWPQRATTAPETEDRPASHFELAVQTRRGRPDFASEYVLTGLIGLIDLLAEQGELQDGEPIRLAA